MRLALKPHQWIAILGLLLAGAILLLPLGGCAHRAAPVPPTPKEQAIFLLAATAHPEAMKPADVAAVLPVARALATATLAGQPATIHDPFAAVSTAGEACVDWGRLVGAIGMVGWVVAWAADAFGWEFGGIAGFLFRFAFNRFVGPFYKVGASIGGAAVAVGIGLEWIGSHPVWSVLLLGAIACGWVLIVHHRDVPRWAAAARATWLWAWHLVAQPELPGPISPMHEQVGQVTAPAIPPVSILVSK